jgi:hypothetical protein
MRILDAAGVEIQTPDLGKGRLVEERIFVAHHEAIEAVAEEGHWEVIIQYRNGGKDVEWVVDVTGVEAAEAWDEYEDIYRYIEYTEAELAETARQLVAYGVTPATEPPDTLVAMQQQIAELQAQVAALASKQA